MDKDSRIWELPDSEFLNFLYNERNREFSKHSNWGVNFWVASASIIALLAYAYHSISVDYELFSWRLVLSYWSILAIIMILGSNLLLPILKNDRWIKNSHITTLYNNAPIVGLLGKLLILIIILVFYNYNNYGIIINSLIILLYIVELSVVVYVSHNLTKLICVKHRGSIFDNWGYEITYRWISSIICLILIIIGIYSWIHQKQFYFREFEIAIVFSIIYGIFWFTYYRICNKRYKVIDEWIDQYLFGSLSKDEVYVYLYEYSQGNDVVEIIYKEHKKLESMVTMIKKREGILEEYRNIIANGNLSYNDIPKYLSFIEKESMIFKKSIDLVVQVKNKISKTKEFLEYSSSIELYSKLFERVSKDTDYIFDYNDKFLDVYEELNKFIASYMCKMSGKLCDKTDCKYRNLKLPFYKRWLLKMYLKWGQIRKRNYR